MHLFALFVLGLYDFCFKGRAFHRLHSLEGYRLGNINSVNIPLVFV